MSIFVVGINHKTAPITLREKIYFSLEKLPLYLGDLLNEGNATEAVILSTCNRSELYCDALDGEMLVDWFCRQTSLPHEEVASVIYLYRDEQAVAHIMQVACGLDSMILGEPQILGQMKEAFSESCTAGAVNTSFHLLFQEIFAVAKEIRTATAIGACPVSVASAAVHFAKQQKNNFAESNIVLIGAGDTTELLIRYLKNHVRTPVTVVNRNLIKAENLVTAMGGVAYGMDDLSLALQHADVVFSATGSALPIVDKALIETIMQSRKAPMVLIDIAVPRDIDPTVKDIEQVSLFCIDDLKAIIETNRQGREHAADKARDMIRKKSYEFMAELGSLDKVSHTIRAYRGQIEEICREQLIKAKQQLAQGCDPQQVLEIFANAFIKKLMHSPSVQLRQAGQEGRFELLRFANQLFAIPDVEAERI